MEDLTEIPNLSQLVKFTTALHEKCPNTEVFSWSVFSWIQTEYGDLRSKPTYSVRIQENTDQKNLRIWILFTQCRSVGTPQGLRKETIPN